MQVEHLQMMPRDLELQPPVPTEESLRPITEANRRAKVAAREAATRLERRRFKPIGVGEGGWLPYIKAAMLQRQHHLREQEEPILER
eukprot:1161521-Pelagomonas_calceolata.AAC.3